MYQPDSADKISCHRIYRLNAFQILLLAVIMTLLFTSGCGPILVAGATYGGAVFHERRTAQTVMNDEAIELQALNLYFRSPAIRSNSHISTTSYNLEVLLTGQARTADIARRFAKMVAQLPHVTKVFNEIQIGPPVSLSRRSQDAYLGSRAKLALADIPIDDFDPLRVKVVVEDGVVYLMGLVTPAESTAVVDKVRRIPGVVRVVRIFNLIHDNTAHR